MKNKQQTVVINVNDETAFELVCSLSEKINPKQNGIKIRMLNRHKYPEKEIKEIDPELVIDLVYVQQYHLATRNYISAKVRERCKDAKIFAVSLLSIFEYDLNFDIISDVITGKTVHELPIIVDPIELIQKLDNIPAIKVSIVGTQFHINEQWDNIVNGLKQAILDYFEKE